MLKLKLFSLEITLKVVDNFSFSVRKVPGRLLFFEGVCKLPNLDLLNEADIGYDGLLSPLEQLGLSSSTITSPSESSPSLSESGVSESLLMESSSFSSLHSESSANSVSY